MPEMITEVDKNDNAIGKRPKEEFFASEHIHRSSHLMLFNSKGETLLQKRAADKKLYPGLYTFAVGGTVRDKETYEQALERETMEEIGIKVEYKRLFKYFSFDKDDKAHETVFSATHEGSFRMHKEEIDTLKWVSLDFLKKELEEHPEKYTPSFVRGMKIYFKKII